jgi:crossover junction endodeoxyribonuclease RusA
MKIIALCIPYPPSVNRIYYNRSNPAPNLRGRGLTYEAKAYKKLVAGMIHYSFPDIKYGKQNVKVSILSSPPNNRGDNHNGLKIVFDAIEMSGIIDNDKQIIALEIIPADIHIPSSWYLKIHPYESSQKASDKTRFFKLEAETI